MIMLLLVGMLTALEIKPAKAEPSLPEHQIDVPFRGQTNGYYCGPACLQMIFSYYGAIISQIEVAEVARTASAAGGTYTDDLRRAAHFSNVSTSMGGEMLENITGYTLRKLGYAAFEMSGITIGQLKTLIDQDYPVNALMLTVPGGFGHFRVVIGYDDTYIYTNDPWTFGGGFGGPNYKLTYAQFDELWDYSGHEVLFACPWQIAVGMPDNVDVGENFTVTANITYPCPAPFLPAYQASSCKATVTLSAGLKLIDGENNTKSLGDLLAGSGTQVSWNANAEAPGHFSVDVESEGNITGFVSAKPYIGPEYYYQDRIGGSNSSTILARGPEGHNIAVSKILLGKNIIAEGYGLAMNVTVENTGGYIENFNMTVWANSTEICTRSLTLEEWVACDLNLNISTSGFAHGNYTVVVHVGPVSNETNTTDNTLAAGWVVVSILCDLAPRLGIVDIFDIVTIAVAYGSRPGDNNWNPNADLYEDNVIDAIDLFIARGQFGKTG